MLKRVGNLKSSCDEEFFRLTRRKREGVVRCVERATTLSDGKRTVTVNRSQQLLAAEISLANFFAGGKFFCVAGKRDSSRLQNVSAVGNR